MTTASQAPTRVSTQAPALLSSVSPALLDSVSSLEDSRYEYSLVVDNNQDQIIETPAECSQQPTESSTQKSNPFPSNVIQNF
jgi:hypothetical protein